jgi:hypothetical protein
MSTNAQPDGPSSTATLQVSDHDKVLEPYKIGKRPDRHHPELGCSAHDARLIGYYGGPRKVGVLRELGGPPSQPCQSRSVIATTGRRWLPPATR